MKMLTLWSLSFRSRILTTFLLILLIAWPTFPCTVAVISAKASREGRPLLWKNRDTSAEDNMIIYIQGKKFGIIALVNANDPTGRNVWAGCNTAGFAIMNSASGDLSSGREGMAENGTFMRRALEECATVLEFENLLQQTNGQRKVGANFGVIDALGNACFFETSSDSYTKFDANDPRVAPDGYIVRTNYAFTAPTPYTGGGYIRFERISHLFQQAAAEKRLSVPFILQQAARDLVNEKIHSFPLAQPLPPGPQPLYINTNDTINRNSTQAVTVFVGAPSPEKAYLTTMWVMLGQPVCTVALPVWAGMNKIPSVLTGEKGSALNHHSQLIEAYLYPDRRGHMTQYLNLSRFLTYRGQGVLPLLLDIEHEILTRAYEVENEWLSTQPSPATMNQTAAELAQWAWEKLRENFPPEEIK
ncbi:carcinine hydrolase/isopenicillin-N N-acyltransferase family protein [Candidatus Aminicenantes bacterium AC-334-K16]|nr:carcinine hydrolase/isopenicillin-N N-acyltransferase family protein [Candidatus Aminicenantes bacterium AC-334-K16]